MSKKSNLPVPIEKENSLLVNDIPAEMLQAMPLLADVLQRYSFVKEIDKDGNFLPEAVEQNMLAQAKLAGDLYILTKVAGLTTLGKGSLEELMCLTPRMESFLGINNDGQNKTIELQRGRIPSGDNSSTKSGNQETKTSCKTKRKRWIVKRIK